MRSVGRFFRRFAQLKRQATTSSSQTPFTNPTIRMTLRYPLRWSQRFSALRLCAGHQRPKLRPIWLNSEIQEIRGNDLRSAARQSQTPLNRFLAAQLISEKGDDKDEREVDHKEQDTPPKEAQPLPFNRKLKSPFHLPTT